MGASRIIVVLLLVAGLAACAGRNFDRGAIGSVVVGTTTADQVRQQFGPPFREGTTIKEGITLKTMSYAFAEAGNSLVGGVIPARSVGYYFRDGVLVGKEFVSSYDAERTAIDEAKVAQIKEGTTTVHDVVAALGPTEGEWIYPLIPRQNEKALVYLYSETRGIAFNRQIRRQHLVVSYNADGLVTKVDYTSTGPSE
jgi:hypothetical protein